MNIQMITKRGVYYRSQAHEELVESVKTGATKRPNYPSNRLMLAVLGISLVLGAVVIW